MSEEFFDRAKFDFGLVHVARGGCCVTGSHLVVGGVQIGIESRFGRIDVATESKAHLFLLAATLLHTMSRRAGSRIQLDELVLYLFQLCAIVGRWWRASARTAVSGALLPVMRRAVMRRACAAEEAVAA